MTFADTQTPKPPRTSPNQPHYSPSHYITWEGDGDLSGLDAPAARPRCGGDGT